MFLLGFRRKLTALTFCKSIESAIQWFQIHHRIIFATIQNSSVYLSGARVSIIPTWVPDYSVTQKLLTASLVVTCDSVNSLLGNHMKCFYNIHAKLQPLRIIKYINFHICTWYKKNTWHVTCVVTAISYFHLSKHSRPSSGSFYRRSLIWVNSVCKSVKRRLYEATEVKCLRCQNQGWPFIFYISIPANIIHCNLVHIFYLA